MEEVAVRIVFRRLGKAQAAGSVAIDIVCRLIQGHAYPFPPNGFSGILPNMVTTYN